MPEEKDLMSAVGDAFGIQDQQQQPQEGGVSDQEGQLDPQLSPQGPQQGEQQPEGGDDRQETGSDRHQPRRGDDKEQLFTDKPRKGPRGELLDRNGNVIAASRREKQLAYNLNRAQYAANQASREARRMHQALGQYQALDQVMKQNNLSPQMAQEALQLRALAEKDPVLAVRDIVARVLSTGVTMEQLFGSDAVPQISARVITNELDRRLGPLEQQTQRAQRHAQIQEQAQEQMEVFVQSHPHAETHGVEISNLVQQHGLSPEKAYYELRSWVERRGFDFTSPLRPQIEAAVQQARRAGGNSRRSTPGSMRGIAPNSGVAPNGSNSRGDFRANAPWKDIAAAVFTELNSK